MALKKNNFNLKETNQLLMPCWIAGQRKFSLTQFVKLFARHEIESVDVAGCCDRIHEIIDFNHASRDQTSKQLNDRSNRFVAFKDLARLTFGVSHILNQQASTLLDDTKHLLDLMRNTSFDLNTSAISIPKTPSTTYVNRKRKRVISKRTTTTICVSKRPRIMSPQLLDENHADYFSNMLTESQLWTKDCQVLNVKESQSFCTSQNLITIKEEITLTEIDQTLLENDGFGELNQGDQKALEAFLPLGNSLKRNSPDPSATSALCYKKSRISNESTTFNNANKWTCNSDLQELDLVQEIERFAVPPVPTPCTPPDHIGPSNLDLVQEIESIVVPQMPTPRPPPVIIFQSKFQNRRKYKLKIDKIIKLSRDALAKDRKIYYNSFHTTHQVNTTSQKANQAIILINSFNLSNRFPDRLKRPAPISEDQMEIDNESTIRAIFGAEYSDTLASNILKKMEVNPHGINCLENLTPPTMPPSKSPENFTIQTTEPQLCNNNNNVVEHFKSYGNENFDSYSIMMDLLSIWQQNPDQKSIDANQFIKGFPDRFKAALAFSHLLTLSADGFIRISTKINSLEIGAITLGPQSIKLIEDISEFN